MFEILKSYLNRYVHFEENELLFFFSQLKPTVYQKKEFLLKKEQICSQYFFILKGVVHFHHTNANGKEHTTMYGIDKWWVTNYDSFIHQTPSNINIQALEDTEVLILDKSSFDKILINIPKFERFFRIITEKAYIASQRRIEHLTQLSTEERYTNFIKETGNFAQRIPQYTLASYLNCTPEFLSTIKALKK